MGLNELLTESDLVTLHCPSNGKTCQIINRESLNQVKAGSTLINVGRGDLLVLDALTEALESGHIAAMALDVFDVEPLLSDHILPKMNHVVVSSHIASVSPKAVHTLRETAEKIVVAALRGEQLHNIATHACEDLVKVRRLHLFGKWFAQPMLHETWVHNLNLYPLLKIFRLPETKVETGAP